MRTSLIVAASVSLGILPTLSGMPSARADDASFFREAHALGFIHAADNLISTARSACYFLRLDRPPGEIEERILRYTRISPPALAHDFFAMAVNEYCPEFTALTSR